MVASRKIALLGKIGHGKTNILNKLCGAHFPSNIAAKSCTRSIQSGFSIKNGILIIDTPGFHSSEDIASHVAAQKYALEGTELSGLYIVVKFGRVDEIAENVGKIMDFIGDDDVRLIITYADIASTQEGYSEEDSTGGISDLLDIPRQNIFITGKEHTQAALESFIVKTLHEPRTYEVSKEQEVYVSSLSIAKRKFQKTIKDALFKIKAASDTCLEIKNGEKSYCTDIAVSITRVACKNMVDDVNYIIFDKTDELDTEEQEFLLSKVQLELLVNLKEFLKASNACFSWDTDDKTEDRNIYRQCPQCHTVYHRDITQNCDEAEVETCAGQGISDRFLTPQARFEEMDGGWSVQFVLGTNHVIISDLGSSCKTKAPKPKKRRLNCSSPYCEQQISWSTMLPINPELILKINSDPEDSVAEVTRYGTESFCCCNLSLITIAILGSAVAFISANQYTAFFPQNMSQS
mmetsp:Transcript_9809/g.13149  ORF Transcript_9809/g.13149 Transcript_9809/m.13149 type:complete len:463 (-) Transcript_9809:325-1713(-)